jgi:Flp pilus assembly protein TadD
MTALSISDALQTAWNLQQAGNPQHAEAIYRQILQVSADPANQGIVANVAEVHSYLGISLATQGRLDEAVSSFKQALVLNHNMVEAYNNLGNVLVMQQKPADAAKCYERALQRKPDYAEAHCNLAVSLLDQDKSEPAMEHLREALKLKPDYSEAHTNLGNALRDLNRYEEAQSSYTRALEIQPAYADAHWNRALAWLMAGDYERGWPEYEWRFRCKFFNPRSFSQPVWQGEPLAGRTILLYGEQGLGDTLQMIRYVRLVKQRGGRVMVECQPQLTGLLTGCPGIDVLAPQGATLPPFDVQASLMSLPAIFKTTRETVPNESPYLFSDGRLIEHWHRQLSGHRGFRIGIVWQGNPQFREDRYRSFPLAKLAPLARLPGVRLFSLQKGHGLEQIEALQKGDGESSFSVVELGSQLDNATGPFVDTAAVIKNLDLIIAPNTGLAHLAGALGAPVWLPISAFPEWRWISGEEETPWYPTMRLFRQKKLGDWDDVFARMAAALCELLASRGAQPISVEVAPGELIDKITILEIKNERITDPAKLHNVQVELGVLTAVRDESLEPSDQLNRLTAELKEANLALWDVEDEIRICEKAKDFGPKFVELARSVYRRNDRRAALKRQINDLLGSKLIEEKAYCDYE